jgi:hypothetical protein
MRNVWLVGSCVAHQRWIRHLARCDFPVPAKASTTWTHSVDPLMPISTARCSASKRRVRLSGMSPNAASSRNKPEKNVVDVTVW